MVIFLVKREFFNALISGKKKAELRVGNMWKKIAEKILRGELRPVAIFRCGGLYVVREIDRIEVYEHAKHALAGGKWKVLGINAKSLGEALKELRKLFPKLPLKPAVLFWLKAPKHVDFDFVMKELRRAK